MEKSLDNDEIRSKGIFIGTKLFSGMDIASALSLFVDGMLHFLEDSASNPISYSFIFLTYTILAAIALPIPVEIGLFFSQETPVAIKVLVMGVGKMIGSILVFHIGIRLGEKIRSWRTDWKYFDRLVDCCEWLVLKFRYLGLYIILSIPIMTDTVPLYLFSLFNENGALKGRWFAVVSLLGGITRGLIVFSVFAILDVKLI